MLIETFRTRVLYKSLDAAMTASLRPRRGLAAEVKTLLGARSSNYDRIASLINTLDGIVPGAARGVTWLVGRPVVAPFPAERVELLAFGSGSTVFRARTDAGDKVIKFYRRSLGADIGRLPGIIGMFRHKYEVVSKWYEDVPGLVWPAEFRALEGPILGRPAVICIQSFIEGEMRDFFTGFALDELAAMMEDSKALRDEFLGFARATMAVCESQRQCVDFLGENNLAIVLGGDRPRLHLIDYGLFEFDATDERTESARPRLEAGLERIGALANRFLPSSQRLAGTCRERCA